MKTHWSADYVGKKWQLGARGPAVFDCWGLVREVYRAQLGIALPDFDGYAQLSQMQRDNMIQAHVVGGVGPWVRLSIPEDFCAVAMSRGKLFEHVGVWIAADGGLVLHARAGRGVVAQTLGALRSEGVAHVRFFRHGPSPISSESV